MAEARQEASSASRRTRGPGAAVGNFYIDSEIGQGSFASVYLGAHKETKEIVAVKTVDMKKLNKKLKDNLYSEIQILKTLRHPHIVALHDCVETPTHINLIMEYCELGDLSLFIKKREKLSTHPVTHDMARKYPSAPNAGLHEVVIRHFLKQIASAMAFLRAGNYVHRDIKPQNLLLLPSPQYRQANSRPIMIASQNSLVPVAGLQSLPMLKLADFGFARVLPSTSLADTLCGSPLYMAPEILRYEKYDAKADLWSIGTVLYEMAVGRPPTKARNHVELLRKIEAAQDVIKFPRETAISSDLKSLIRDLLKRQAMDRLSFERFFNHPTVVDEIPGLVEDDIPAPAPRPGEKPVERPAERPIERSLSRHSLLQMQRNRSSGDLPELTASPTSRSPRERGSPSPKPSSPPAIESRLARPALDSAPRNTYPSSSGQAGAAGEGLGIRPRPHATNTAPARPQGLADASGGSSSSKPPSNLPRASQPPRRRMTEEEKAAQDVADMREYVVIEKKQVEINVFADEIEANRRLPPHGTAGGSSSQSPRSQALVGRGRSQDQAGSPNSTTRYITKTIQDASIRWLGYNNYNSRPGKGQSPPLYNPFLAYPAPSQPAGLIGEGGSTGSADDDTRSVQAIEDLATRSDVVYGFAEVKFKQIFPLTPSAERGLGGASSVQDSASADQDLTAEAIVNLSEEAFVLYIKGLTLLAKAMDLANSWWSSVKRRPEGARDTTTTQSLIHRVNGMVQWIRTRFNEVLDKTETVKLKLIDGQRRLPDTHPSHPNNHGTDSKLPTVSSVAVITTGVTAEKLMYDRALEMSRSAAIREISYNDLPGCEISYLTAIRMLEVVILDGDDEEPARRRVSSLLGESGESNDEPVAGLDVEDKKAVKKLIEMITARLSTVRKKMRDIAEAEKNQQATQVAARRRSGDGLPRSLPSHASPS